MMNIQVQIGKNHGDGTVVRLPRAFNFNVYDEFRKACEGLPATSHMIFDMREVENMDSSALGMLLWARDYFGGDTDRLKITNCQPRVQSILSVAHFDRFFRVLEK
uniref:Putative Anti-anti-sigma regulatory factor n=1 Tax=Magnetococcus massalia (strain MO-1) TaxID=451514 RepID=A0A1S7LGQ8_MAGMO|nr:putative Anti-anti-sigma regulatory factor [Candidatus Magnetococcus massalia]